MQTYTLAIADTEYILTFLAMLAVGLLMARHGIHEESIDVLVFVSEEQLTHEVETEGDEPFILHPGEFVLGSTYEVVTLPDDMLTKVDRASMHWSLETRLPFLDPRVVALAWRLPREQLTHGHTGKVLVRQILARHLPPALLEGPKRGFDPPLAEWLRGRGFPAVTSMRGGIDAWSAAIDPGIPVY